MALSDRTKKIMIVGLADKKAGEELAAAVDAGGNPQAATVAALAAYASVGTTDGAGGAGDAALAADVDTELGAVYTKINDILTALKNAGLMA